jgi:hypothetical protein
MVCFVERMFILLPRKAFFLFISVPGNPTTIYQLPKKLENTAVLNFT